DHQVHHRGDAVGELEAVCSVAEWGRGDESMSPTQAAGLYVPGEHGSELSAVDLWRGVVALVGDERGEHRAVLVKPVLGLSFRPGERVELVEQAGVFNGDLPGV